MLKKESETSDFSMEVEDRRCTLLNEELLVA